MLLIFICLKGSINIGLSEAFAARRAVHENIEFNELVEIYFTFVPNTMVGYTCMSWKSLWLATFSSSAWEEQSVRIYNSTH